MKKKYLEPQTLGGGVVCPIVPANQRFILQIVGFQLYLPILALLAIQYKLDLIQRPKSSLLMELWDFCKFFQDTSQMLCFKHIVIYSKTIFEKCPRKVPKTQFSTDILAQFLYYHFFPNLRSLSDFFLITHSANEIGKYS